MEVMNRLVHFFFSSRRRHTRLQGDWSSDVCSPISADCTTNKKQIQVFNMWPTTYRKTRRFPYLHISWAFPNSERQTWAGRWEEKVFHVLLWFRSNPLLLGGCHFFASISDDEFNLKSIDKSIILRVYFWVICIAITDLCQTEGCRRENDLQCTQCERFLCYRYVFWLRQNRDVMTAFSLTSVCDHQTPQLKEYSLTHLQ